MRRVLKLLLVCAVLCGHGAAWATGDCERLTMAADGGPEQALRHMLESVRLLEPQPEWTQIVRSFLLPAVASPSSSLVLTLVGPSNVGKSLVFNSLLGPGASEAPSPVSFNSESTARPVVMFDASAFDQQGAFDARFRRTERWRSPEQVMARGVPLTYPAPGFFRNLIFVDTPAFTALSTRNEVLQQLAISDVIIYVFSNSNYAEDSILDFLRHRMAERGPRDLILIYNVNKAILPAYQEEHFRHVANRIFGIRDSREMPSGVLAYYHLVHNDRVAAGDEPVQLIPLGGSPAFQSLLGELNSNAHLQRRQSLNFSLKFVLESAERTIKNTEKVESELEILNSIFDVYLGYLTASQVNVPYHRLGSELERIWNRQSGGLRGFAHWIARPLEMAGFYNRSREPEAAALTEVQRYLEALVDKVVADFRLGVAEGVIRIPHSAAKADQLIALIDQFREKHPEAATPSYAQREDTLEIVLPKSEPVQRILEQYLRRDWSGVSGAIKTEAKENLSNLILQIQSRLPDLAASQNISLRARQSFYTAMSVVPAIAAAGFLIYRGTSLSDVEALATIIGVHLSARMFVGFDERALHRGWSESVKSWLEERQQPRLLEIFDRNVRLPKYESVAVDKDKLREAIATLQVTGMAVE